MTLSRSFAVRLARVYRLTTDDEIGLGHVCLAIKEHFRHRCYMLQRQEMGIVLWRAPEFRYVFFKVYSNCNKQIKNICSQGRIQPKVEGGGAICRVGTENITKSKRAEGAQKSLGLYSGKFSGFPIFRTKFEKRLHLGQDKGRPTCRKWSAAPS